MTHIYKIVALGLIGGMFASGVAIALVARDREVIVERVVHPTADVLDVGPSCAYVFGAQLRVWAKQDRNAPCPPAVSMQREWAHIVAAQETAAAASQSWQSY